METNSTCHKESIEEAMETGGEPRIPFWIDESKYVVDGALLKCRNGNLESWLILFDSPMIANERSVATKSDCIAGRNIWPFGTCEADGMLCTIEKMDFSKVNEWEFFVLMEIMI